MVEVVSQLGNQKVFGAITMTTIKMKLTQQESQYGKKLYQQVVSIYRNPTTGITTVRTNTFDTSGKLVKSNGYESSSGSIGLYIGMQIR